MNALARLVPHIQKVFSLILLVSISLFCSVATADEVLRYNLGTSGSSIPYENTVEVTSLPLAHGPLKQKGFLSIGLKDTNTLASCRPTPRV